jgi:hypothetical protein
MPAASHSPRPSRASRLLSAGGRTPSPGIPWPLAAAFFAALLGCAAPGEPTPRQPVVPRAVRDLAAQQQGDAVVLRFTLPTDSTRGEPLAAPPAVEIYRAAAPPGPTSANGKPRLVDTIPAEMLDAYVKNGRVEFPDPLDPAMLAQEPGEQMLYTVRTRVSSRHASAVSNTSRLHVYPAPPAVRDLRATLTQQAIDLSWTPPQPPAALPGSAVAAYRVFRAEIEPSAAAAAVANPNQAALRAPLAQLTQTATSGYHDTHFEFGHTYLYIVRSVAQFGSASVESANSNPVVIPAKDIFPPAAPQALEAVIVPATAETPVYVSLTWAFNTEPDLAGYAVYRSEQPGEAGERLNSRLLPAPSFRDTSAEPGHRYFYRVQAEDRAGNQSPFSAPVAVELPAK